MTTSSFDTTIATRLIVHRRERELRWHFFEQIEGEGAPRKIPLIGTKVLIGREPEAIVSIASKRASLQHARLIRDGGEFTIIDNDSVDGVFLNGVKIHSAVLRDGDIIQIADCAFVYREG